MSMTINTLTLDRSDVPTVSLHDLYAPMRRLIAEGRGLALLHGLSEADIRDCESHIWADFADQPELRVAIALRFRALLDVFAKRRLRQEFLHRGFKLIARAVAEASGQRLNTRFGFNAQKFVNTLAPVPRSLAVTHAPKAATQEFALAA